MMLILQFLLAHIIGDFFLQPNAWVVDKERKKMASGYLYLHVAIHFILLIAITGFANGYNFSVALIPAVILAITHLAIDSLKLIFQNPNNKRRCFFLDQLAHLLSIVIVGFLYSDLQFDPAIFQDKQILILISAYLFVLKPASLIIKMLIAKWTPPTLSGIKPSPELIVEQESLAHAGEWIGMLERSLVLTFILSGHWEAVGFLITAKSVFRFGDIKASREMKLTEYVLIGTLLSFGIAILTGIIALEIINNY